MLHALKFFLISAFLDVTTRPWCLGFNHDREDYNGKIVAKDDEQEGEKRADGDGESVLSFLSIDTPKQPRSGRYTG